MHDFADNIISAAEENEINLIVLTRRQMPWSIQISNDGPPRLPGQLTQLFDDKYAKALIIQSVCARAKCSVAVMLDRGFNVGIDTEVSVNQDTVRSINSYKLRSSLPQLAKIFIPFIGGSDDREALLFILQFHRGVEVHVCVLVNEQPKLKEIAVDLQDSSTTIDHTSLVVDSSESSKLQDTELLDILNEEVKLKTQNPGESMSGTIAVEYVEVGQLGSFASALGWIRNQEIGQSDMLVLGRTLYEHGRTENETDTVFEKEVKSSITIVQHKPFKKE